MASDHDLGVALVIGGCGYLGSNLVRALQGESTCSEIHVVSRSPSQNLFADVTYHAGDIANTQEMADLFSQIRPRVVFHTASPKDTAPEGLLRRTDVDGIRVLLTHAAETTGVCAFVYTSSDSALDQMPGVKQTEETAKLHTEHSKANPYARTKAMADFEVQMAHAPPTLSTTVIRIPGLYGEYDDNCVGTLLNTIKKDEHKIQIGDNKRLFEFVYVEKACEAHILAAKRLLAADSTVGGEAFFISDGICLPYFDFARKLYAGAGYCVPDDQVKVIPLWLIVGLAYLGEWLYWIFTLNTKVPLMRSQRIMYLGGGCQWDITKAKERLGYEPVPDQDAVLKKVAESESERLGIKIKNT